MTLEIAFLWFAELVMAFALFCFVRGFAVRKTDLAAHMRWGKLGALTVFVGLLAVEILSRGLGWDFPIRSQFFGVPFDGQAMLRAHIIVASMAFALLLLLVVTGMARKRSVHVKLYLLFFPAFIATIVLSLLAFELW